MKILVTAFGPFGGRPWNASSLALQGLKGRFPAIHTRILPVDSVAAPSRMKQALNRIRPAALIMLGEVAGSHTIRLETTAWNELDFRIPDIAGRQPALRKILSDAPEHYPSTLPLDEIHHSLLQAGHPVSLSDDPGRYLCNQIFYIARHHLETRAIRCPAGFIHLPLEHDYPTLRATEALSDMIQAIAVGAGYRKVTRFRFD